MKTKILNPAEDSKSNEKLMSENEVLDLTVKQSRLHIERKCRDETIELLHQSKSLIEKLKVSGSLVILVIILNLCFLDGE